jgi:peptide/nickel transport system ATP-binding protein
MCALQLEIQNISKAFQTGLFTRKPRCILEDISFKVEKGQTFGIGGESGTGKTTLGKIIAAIEKPTSGEIFFQGNPLKGMKREEFSKFRKKVQMMFQDPEGSLNPKKTIKKSMEEVLDLIKIPKEKWPSSIRESFQTVGLDEEILVRYPNEVSGGQNQRVALARILLLEPEIIVLDEPTSALDLSVQAQILNLLKDLQRQKGLTYIFISHDLDVVKFMCHETGIIENRHIKFHI